MGNSYSDRVTVPSSRRSSLAMIVLALLAEAPMHPYRIQRLIEERGQDQVVNVARRNSIYQTIDRLQRDGLISVGGTERGEGRPDRTTYEITAQGRETLRNWLLTALAVPAREFPQFRAAVAIAMLLEPDEVRAQLEAREHTLQQQLAEAEADMAAALESLPRLFLIETEHRIVVDRAELDWVRALIADLRQGRLAWSAEWLRPYTAGATEPPDAPGRGASD